MPTYQYVCTDPQDKHDFEVVQSFSDPAVATCPECSAPVRKVYGSVGVVFKGSGFYRTDSRKPEGSSAPSAGKASATKESTGSAGKDSAGSASTGSSASPSPAASGTSSKAAS